MPSETTVSQMAVTPPAATPTPTPTPAAVGAVDAAPLPPTPSAPQQTAMSISDVAAADQQHQQPQPSSVDTPAATAGRVTLSSKRFWRGTETMSSEDMWAMISLEYEVGEPFGTGKDGTCIRAGKHRASGRRVALKVVPTTTAAAAAAVASATSGRRNTPAPTNETGQPRPPRSSSTNKRDRALREGRILAALPPHRNVVSFFNMFECATSVVVVVEFCERGDLLDRVNGHGKFTEDEARRMFTHIVEGLSHCFRHGIAHRDIKLDNIFIQWDPVAGEEVLKLGDFGFADLYQAGLPYTHSCGTVNYAGPELLVHKSNVCYDGELADVWSAGIVLYSLLCGVLPFNGSSTAVLIERIRAGVFFQPHSLSSSVRVLLTQLINVDPRARPTLQALQTTAWYKGPRPVASPASYSSSASSVSEILNSNTVSGANDVSSNGSGAGHGSVDAKKSRAAANKQETPNGGGGGGGSKRRRSLLNRLLGLYGRVMQQTM